MTNPVPEMPDCRLCKNLSKGTDDNPFCWAAANYCTNGSEFKPAEPIRLYTITSEDKT
jgi:hypothetical protein